MTPGERHLLKGIMRSLDDHMLTTQKLELDIATYILAMAKLELASKTFDVSGTKLKQICDLLQSDEKK